MYGQLASFSISCFITLYLFLGCFLRTIIFPNALNLLEFTTSSFIFYQNSLLLKHSFRVAFSKFQLTSIIYENAKKNTAITTMLNRKRDKSLFGSSALIWTTKNKHKLNLDQCKIGANLFNQKAKKQKTFDAMIMIELKLWFLYI